MAPTPENPQSWHNQHRPREILHRIFPQGTGLFRILSQNCNGNFRIPFPDLFCKAVEHTSSSQKCVVPPSPLVQASENSHINTVPTPTVAYTRP